MALIFEFGTVQRRRAEWNLKPIPRCWRRGSAGGISLVLGLNRFVVFGRLTDFVITPQ